MDKKITDLKPYQLNCNIFDVYSYNGLTMQDLLCQFFTKINECVDFTNENLNLTKWLVDEGLSLEVVEKINEYIKDGTFENLINNTILNKITLKLDNEVRLKNTLIDLDDFTPRTLDAIQGGEGTQFSLESVPRDYSVTYDKLDENLNDIVLPSFNDISLNVRIGMYWDKSKSGELTVIEDVEYGSIAPITVKEGETFIITGRSVWNANLYIIKDADDRVLSIYPNTNATGTNYDNIRFSIPTGGVKLLINSYSTYPTKLKKLDNVDLNYNKIKKLNKGVVNFSNFNEGLQKLYKTKYFNKHLSFNEGGYYQNTSMELREHEDFQYIKINCNEGECYRISGATSYEANLYIIQDINGNKLDIFPNTNESGKTYDNIEFTIPENGAFILINQRKSVKNTVLEIKEPYIEPNTFLNVNWCAFGDSLTDVNTLEGDNYTNFVANSLGLNLTNCGKGGTGYLANNNGHSKPFYQRVDTIPTNTDILTIFGSFNDMFVSNYKLGTINDNGTDTVYGAIKTMVNEAFKVNNKIIVALITPTPWSGRWRGHSNNSENVIKYVQAIIDVANYYSIPCLNLFDCSNLRPWDNNFNNEYFLNADGTHPNTIAHKKYLYPKIENFIKSIIKN